jgi:hypothetical protein
MKKLIIHIFYWILLLTISLSIHSLDIKKTNNEVEWCRQEQYEAKIENKRLKKELQHFWNINRMLLGRPKKP